MIDQPTTPESGSAEDESSNAPEDSETTTIPIDFCPGMTPKEGDTYKVKVVSVDEDSGTQTISYVGKPVEKRGIKAATEMYNQGE